MKDILEPLARIPGVRNAIMVTSDGVLIASESEWRSRRPAAPAGDGAWQDSAEDLDALAGLATGWMGEIKRATGPLSWEPPRRLVLKASRGTLVIQQAEGAILVVVLHSGMRAEELRLPLEGAVARMQRHLRSKADKAERRKAAVAADKEHDGQERVPGIFPAEGSSPAAGTDPVQTTGNVIPDESGEA